MSKNDYMWSFYEGRVYDLEELKLPHVVPVIESLPYATDRPVAVDIGGGNYSIIHSARLPMRRYFRTATVDLATKPHGLEPINPTIKANVEAIASGSDDGSFAAKSLIEFLTSGAGNDGRLGADLLVYSEVLNYIDYRSVMSWFDQYLKPGGYTVIANLPTRGWPNLFSENGVKSHAELLDFVQVPLGHSVVAEQYPWGATDDNEGFMVVATQKPSVAA